jgi:hypothetical protein
VGGKIAIVFFNKDHSQPDRSYVHLYFDPIVSSNSSIRQVWCLGFTKEEMAPLPRELIRWMQMLSLPFPVRQPKRDLANGYLFAEICARYWQDVELHMYENKCSQKNKESNWKALRKVFQDHQVPVSEEEIQDTIHMRDNVAIHVLEVLYTALTNRIIQHVAPMEEPEVAQIPTFIRSTTNVGSTSLVMEAPSPAAKDVPSAAPSPQKEPASPKKTAPSPRTGKPKPPQKSGAIKAVGLEDAADGADAKPIQFAAVTVKALAPQTLQRMGQSAEGDRVKAPTRGSGDATEAWAPLQPVSEQLEKVLHDTGTPLWSLSGTTPTYAEYFSKNKPYLSPSLRNIVWSRLIAGADDVAAWLLSHPADFPDMLRFADSAIAQDTAETVPDNDRCRQYLSTVLAALFHKNSHLSLSLVSTALMPMLAQSLLNNNAQWARSKTAAVLRNISSVPHLAQQLLTILHESLQREKLKMEKDAFGNGTTLGDPTATYILTLQAFLDQFATSTTSAAKGPQRVEDDSALESSPVAQLLPFLQYHATLALHHSSPVTRAAGLALEASIARRGPGSAISAHTLKYVEGILSRSPESDFDIDNTAQALFFVTTVAKKLASYYQHPDEDSTEDDWPAYDPQLQHKSTIILRILAKLCSKGLLFDSQTFSSGLRIHVLREVGTVLGALPNLVGLAHQSTKDAETIGSNFLESILALPAATFMHLISKASPAAAVSAPGKPATLSPTAVPSTLFRSQACYATTNAANDWSPLPLISAAVRRWPPAPAATATATSSSAKPAQATGAEVNKPLIDFTYKVLLQRDANQVLCQRETDLPRWWDLMRTMVPDIEASMYNAEITQQRQGTGGKGPTEAEKQILEFGSACAELVERFYLHLSGVPIATSGEDNASLRPKALEWFRTVVVSSG